MNRIDLARLGQDNSGDQGIRLGIGRFSRKQVVARLLAQGFTNEQIAAKLGFQDKRTISRVNGQIYAAWDLNGTASDEKVARTRAAIITRTGRLLRWDEQGNPLTLDEQDEWAPWTV